MLQLVVHLPAGIQHYLDTTPLETMAAHALFAVGWIPIAGVLIWGLIQIWVDNRQGLYASKLKWQLLHVSVPADAIQTPKGMENFFTNMIGIKSTPTWKEEWIDGKFQGWFSFEIVSLAGEVRFYIRTIQKYRDMLEAALYAQYPEAQITEVEDYVGAIPDDYPNDDWDVWGSEAKLSKPTYLPIKTWEVFEHQGEKDQRFKDPLLSILEAMGKMMPGEHYFMQFLIMPPLEDKWVKEGEKAINKLYGKEEKKKSNGLGSSISWLPAMMADQITGGGLFGESGGDAKADDFVAFKITPREKEQIDGIAKKISQPGWYTKIRVVYAARKEVFRKGTIASLTKGLLGQYGHLNLNKFGLHAAATPNDDYFWQEWEMPGKQRNLVRRYKSRSMGEGATAYILTPQELATLFHFPAADARTPVLTALGSRRSEAPKELQFAAADAPDLPNLQRKEPDMEASINRELNEARRPLATPHLTPPAGTPAHAMLSPDPVATESPVVAQAPVFSEEEHMPRPGMPAPLPPGLDLADEPIDGEGTPNNLPL